MQRPEIPTPALEGLGKLGHFWSFPRKKLVLEISSYLRAFQEQANAQHDQLITALALANQQEQDLARLDKQAKGQLAQIADLDKQLQLGKQLLTQLAQRLGDAQQKGKEVQEERDQARALGAHLQARQIEAAHRIGDLETLVSQQGRELDSNRQSIALLHETNEQWATSQAGLQENLQQITNQHLTLREKFELVQRILALQTPANTGLENFAQLIHEDYRRFAAQESSLADEAGALLELQAIHRELELIVDFPSARGKTLLAIAGGYSSGKSRFINSFISGGEVTLAVGMNPVTVVPSYVVCGEQPKIRGYAANGGSFNLSKKLYASLSHEYLESFGFDLRGIMPFISVQVPMRAELFEHLCLIDTPGYNPGGGQTTSADHGVAQSFVGQAAAMIWVIGLDPAGTITQSDLDFIEKTGLYGESLYILLNKADTKSAAATEDIINEVEARLENYGFEFAGICAYSSRKRQIHAWHGQSLEDFLRHHNHRHNVIGELVGKIDGVFDRYRQAIAQDLDRQVDRHKHFERFKLETLEVGGSELYKAVSELSRPIESDFDTLELKTLASECEKLRKRFKEAARATLDEVLNANTTGVSKASSAISKAD